MTSTLHTAIAIPVTGQCELRRIDYDDPRTYEALAGARPIDFMVLRPLGIIVVVGDFSLIDGSLVNPRATDLIGTLIADRAGALLHPLCGDVGILGVTDEGDYADVPAEVVSRAVAMLAIPVDLGQVG